MITKEIAIRNLSNIINGINPITGKIFKDSEWVNHPDIIRTFSIALRSLEGNRIVRSIDEYQIDEDTTDENQSIKEIMCDRAGENWTRSEEHKLIKEYSEDLSIESIAQIHLRTTGAIQSRLVKLNVIDSNSK